MNSNLAIKRALDELEGAMADLQFDLARRKLERALLELRYIPQQPRVPAGNPDGGQWTSEDGLPGTGRLPAGTQRVAQAMGRLAFSGYLERQDYLSSENMYECTYFDSRQNYRFVERWNAPCPAIRLFY